MGCFAGALPLSKGCPHPSRSAPTSPKPPCSARSAPARGGGGGEVRVERALPPVSEHRRQTRRGSAREPAFGKTAERWRAPI
jgi:hypothetical protein